MNTIHICVRRTWASGSKGGLERAATRHLRALAERGHSVCLHAPGHEAGIATATVPWPSWGSSRVAFPLAYASWMKKLAESVSECWSEGDVAHFHGAASGALRWLSPHVARASVANPHGMEEFTSPDPVRAISRLPIRQLSRAGSRSAAKLIATDAKMIPVVVRNFQIEPERVVLIENGVNVAKLEKIAANGSATCTSKSIITVGRIVPNKGYDLLLEALKRYATRVERPLQWHHYGNGPSAHGLESAAATSPVKLTIHRHASDEEVQASLREAWLFVQPSRYEGSSLTVLEAMAQQTLVIATPVGGIPDKIINGETGILSREPSATALHDSLALAEIVPRQELVQAALSHVRENFSEDAEYTKHVALYKQVSGAE